MAREQATVIDYLARHPEVKAQVADLLLPSPPGPGKGTKERACLASLRRHKQDWTVEELREQNLPLYWNHGWLLEQLRQLRSVEEVARQHGYKPLTLQSYVFRHPELHRAVEELRLERREKLQGVHLRLPGELSERLAQDPRSKIGLVEKAARWKMSQAPEAQEARSKRPGPHREPEAQGLPLYRDREWLAGELRRLGSARRLAQEWGYPWGEVARFARRFGLTAPGQRPWKATFVMLDRDLVQQIDQASKAAGVSRNRWIVQALEQYLAHEDAAMAAGELQLSQHGATSQR